MDDIGVIVYRITCLRDWFCVVCVGRATAAERMVWPCTAVVVELRRDGFDLLVSFFAV